MSECYIMRWPRDLSASYVNGATISYSKNQSVYYANEVLSPGQIICTWSSTTAYLSCGHVPTLPLLKINKTYELEVRLAADNVLPVQIEINFFDANQELLESYRSTSMRLTFRVPVGTASYQVYLINLKHKWIRFECLSIIESGVTQSINDFELSQHYEWVQVRPIRRSNHKMVQLIIHQGPRNIIPISLHESIDYDQIFVYTDGQKIDLLLKSLSQILPNEKERQIMIEGGLGFYRLPSESIKKIIKELKPNDQEE